MLHITELGVEVERIARGLIALGVARGDRVGIWSPNRAEWLIAQYASAKAGAILVNVNPAYRLRELEYTLRQSGVSVLIAARGFRSADYVAMLDELAPALPALKTIVYLGSGHHPDALSWSEVREERAQEIADIVRDRMQGATPLAVPLTVDIGIGANWKDAKS